MALAGNFTVGRDVTAVLIASNGTRVDLGGVTDFKWTPQYKQARMEPLNGPPIQRSLPNGHKVSFNIDRIGPANEALISQIEQGWWSIGSADPGTQANTTAYFYFQETDGSQSTMQFQGGSIELSSGGDYKTDSPVKQSFECHFSRGQKV